MAWTRGDQLQGGKYNIREKLGDGGFGITYRARNSQGQQVVIKTMNETLQQHPEFAKFQQDFMSEALRLTRCSHPHIVQVYEVIQEGALWCMVMEYIDGEDLARRVINQGAIHEAEALGYILPIGEALIVVHNQGLLHRDIKPQNIMVRSGSYDTVLIDFGIAREFTPDLTQTHTQMFTPGFAPIEQYELKGKRGAYTDVYALAATLYTLLTGAMPEAAPTRDRRVVRNQQDPLVTPQQINSNISDRVNQAILEGMQIDPEDRPQSMADWLALLGGGTPPPPRVRTPLPRAGTPQPPNIGGSSRRSSLTSAVGMDYTRLRDLLVDGKWRAADQETATIMQKIAGRQKQGWLRVEDIDNFPGEDLRTIDQLWVNYSNGRYGFTVQKRIWEKVEKDDLKFGECVGWQGSKEWKEWLHPDSIEFQRRDKEGHLPSWKYLCQSSVIKTFWRRYLIGMVACGLVGFLCLLISYNGELAFAILMVLFAILFYGCGSIIIWSTLHRMIVNRTRLAGGILLSRQDF